MTKTKKVTLILILTAIVDYDFCAWALAPGAFLKKYRTAVTLCNSTTIEVDDHTYPPDEFGSYMFQLGVRPRPHSSILVLGAGSGVDGILAMERGAREVVLSDIDANAIKTAQRNVAQSLFSANIEIIQADLFNSDALRNRRFSAIYFALPSPFQRESGGHTTSDPGGKLLERLLTEAKDHLEEGGTLEITYFETPEVIQTIYKNGWEPMIIEGTNFFRTVCKFRYQQESPIDYVRFTLALQRDKKDRFGELDKILMRWKALKSVSESHGADLHHFLSVANEVFLEKLTSPDFSGQLIAKGAYDLIRRYRMNDATDDQLPGALEVPNIRFNYDYYGYVDYPQIIHGQIDENVLIRIVKSAPSEPRKMIEYLHNEIRYYQMISQRKFQWQPGQLLQHSL